MIRKSKPWTRSIHKSFGIMKPDLASSTLEKWGKKCIVWHLQWTTENNFYDFQVLAVANPLLPQLQKWLLCSAIGNYWEFSTAHSRAWDWPSIPAGIRVQSSHRPQQGHEAVPCPRLPLTGFIGPVIGLPVEAFSEAVSRLHRKAQPHPLLSPAVLRSRHLTLCCIQWGQAKTETCS